MTAGLLAVLAIIPMAAMSSCASPGAAQSTPLANVENAINSPQGQQAIGAAEQVLGTVATTALAALVQKETGTAGVNVAQSAASALWSGVGTLESSGAVQNAIAAFSNNALPGTAKYAGAIMATPNGNSTTAVTNAIAAVISTASGAPPASPALAIKG